MARLAVKLSEEMEGQMVVSKARKRFTSQLRVGAATLTLAAETLRDIDKRECPEAHQREAETFSHPCESESGSVMGDY
jgi:hypothetical protein